MPLEKIFSNFGLSGPTGELILVFVVLLVGSIAFWFAIGRFRIHNFLINLYIAYAVLQTLPEQAKTFTKNGPAIAFILVLMILMFVARNLFDIHQSGSGLPIWAVVVMCFLQVGLLSSIILSLVSQRDVAAYVSRETLFYFTSPWAISAWMVMPLAFLGFMGRRE